jgi:hypothetical protein
MKTQTRFGRRHCLSFFAAFALATAAPAFTQAAKPLQEYPARLPYAFSNFVWWSDEELRAALKKRIPDLGDEIATSANVKGQIRSELKQLLRDKGIVADVLSEEPSDFALTAETVPGAPSPAIVFSIGSPKILVDKVVISQAPDDLLPVLTQRLETRAGHEYSERQDWLVSSDAGEELKPRGYLDALIDVTHDVPRRSGDHYLVNLLISIKSGQQFRIGSITADGGPLLTGRDLSPFFTAKVGDVAGSDPFGRLGGELRDFYEKYGYADVKIQGPPVLDRAHALVSYHLGVTPGQVYHLRILTVHNLNAEQESKVRELLGMKAGDVFDGTAIGTLYHRLSTDPSMASLGFTFSPTKDKSVAMVDLTLDFYHQSDNSSVTIK